jgi:hypothetical protein
LVRAYDGTYSLIKTANAAALAAANRPPTPRYRAFGGNIYDPKEQGIIQPWINAALPESVTVTFPKYNNTLGKYVDPERTGFFTKDSYGEIYAIDVTLAMLGSPYSNYEGFAETKTMQDTCKALLLSDGASTPTNLATLQALAMQLAQDYYDYQLQALDEAYNGIRDWSPEPLNDIIFDYLPPNLVQTRVVRKPWDFQVDQMQHHVPSNGNGTVTITIVTNVCPIVLP